MLTPQEVSEHAFAKASFGGYNMAMVDEFLDALTTDYTSLYKDNATLKAKMKVLVEKVEEYRATEEAMRKALMTAQKMADELVAQAEEQKKKMLADAEVEAKDRTLSLRREIESEQHRLASAQEATAAYVEKLKELYKHEMDYLSGLAQLTAPANRAQEVTETAQHIEASIAKAVEADPVDLSDTVDLGGPVEEALPQETEGEPGGLYAELLEQSRTPANEGEEPTRRMGKIDFDNLQFGADYEIE